MKKEVQLLGIPFDKKSSFLRGPAQAPALIRETLHSGAYNYTAENGINIATEREVMDLGDLSAGVFADLHIQLERALSNSAPVIFLGGDHSITFPIVKRMQQLHGEFDVLHFDAHSDLYDNYEGDLYSHACPFARIMEKGLARRLVQIGIRTLNRHQQHQAERFGVEICTMRELSKSEALVFDRPLYISIDIDGFDPAYAPGVSHQEPGGLSPRFVIDFLHRLDVPVIGADIVEFNPERDHSGITAALCAKLLKELIAMV